MAILAIRDPLGSGISRLVLSVVAVVSVIMLVVMLSQCQRLAGHDLTLAAANVRDGDVMSYIVTYFLPFLDVSRGKLEDALSLVLMYLVVAFIYINSNLIYINPVLSLLGYRVLEIVSTDHKTSTLITRHGYVRAGQTLAVVSLDNYVLLEKRS